jgi:O-antigen ligase
MPKRSPVGRAVNSDRSAVLLSKGNSSLPAATPPWVGRQAAVLQAVAAWTMAGVLVYLLNPRAAPFLIPLSLVAPLLARWASNGRMRWPPPSAVFATLVLAAIYLLINCTWSLSPAAAYSEVACLGLFIAALYATVAVLRVTQAPLLRAMATGFVAAMLLGGAFLCFETFSGQAVHRLILAFAPSWKPPVAHLRMEGQRVAFLEPHLLNRSMTALSLLIWPAALAIIGLGGEARKQRLLLLLGLAVIVAAIFRSEHGTSKLAFIGAAATYGLCLLVPTATRRLVIAAWIAATLFVAPLASLAYAKQLYLASWLPRTAGMRLVIWGYTSGQIHKAPLLGVGVSSARTLSHGDDAHPVFAPGSDFRVTTGWHSHNAYLQTWFETGAIGAALLLVFGLLVLRSVAASPAALRPYLYATFVSCALMANSSFSLWAPWFLASFALAAVFAVLGTELASRSAQTAGDAHPPAP